VVLCEVALEDGRGLELLRATRALSPVPQFFLMSAQVDAAVGLEAYTHGAGVLPKPVGAAVVGELLARVSKAARRPTEVPAIGRPLCGELAGAELVLARRLLEAAGDWVPTRLLSLELGRRDAAGVALVWQHVHRLRPKLEQHGLVVDSSRARGYRLRPAAKRDEDGGESVPRRLGDPPDHVAQI